MSVHRYSMVVVLVVIGMCLYYSYYFNRVLILNVLLCEFNLDILIILPMGRIIRAIRSIRQVWEAM